MIYDAVIKNLIKMMVGCFSKMTLFCYKNEWVAGEIGCDYFHL